MAHPGYTAILGCMKISVILVLSSFLVMSLGFYVRKRRGWHITLMSSVMLFDTMFPLWLFLTHHWKRRLIDNGELLSFLIWTHFMLILTLYSLYVLQVLAGRQLYGGLREAREPHRMQGTGIFAVRVFVFLTGALLIAPD